MHSLQILVAEDYDAFRQFICSTLHARAEFQVTEAVDGVDAIRKAEESKPDLLLLDIGLPQLNGIDVAKRVRKLAPAAKILFLTQESSPEVIREVFNLGARGYVHKLRAHTDLLPAIDSVLRGQRFLSTGLKLAYRGNGDDFRHHEIRFCSSDAVVLDSLACFIAAYLNAGDAAIVWVTKLHCDSLILSLRVLAVDVDGAIQRGRFMLSDATETADPIRIREAIRGLRAAASKAGKKDPRIAVCGERAGLLWAEGKTDLAIRVEQICNELAKSGDTDILCPYPMPHAFEDNHEFETICAAHSSTSIR